MAKQAKKSSKKIGRNADWCKAYRMSGTREKNQLRRLLRHTRRYGTTDHMAVHFFNNAPQRVILGLPALTPTKSLAKRIAPKVAMDRTRPTPKMEELAA